MAELALQTTLHIKTTHCIQCGCIIGMEREFYDCRLNDHAVFYCQNGHGQNFMAESDWDKGQRLLREEQARHARTLTRENEERLAKERLERQLKRVGRGVCPECNRSFQNLARHMACKHAEKASK